MRVFAAVRVCTVIFYCDACASVQRFLVDLQENVNVSRAAICISHSFEKVQGVQSDTFRLPSSSCKIARASGR